MWTGKSRACWEVSKEWYPDSDFSPARSYVSTGKTSKSAEEGQPKKHLHHILHKLGNAVGNDTNDGLARRDLDDDVSALEDGLVDYGFGAGPEKAIGRGKQEGDQHVVYGGVEHSSSGGGSDSEEKEDEQETGRFDSGEGGFRRTIFRFYHEVLLPPFRWISPTNVYSDLSLNL